MIIRHFYDRPPEDQLLVTFGIAIVIVELVRFGFGSLSKTVPPPTWAAGVTPMGFLIYPTYRIVVAGIAAAALGVLYVVLYRTRLGMIVRAGIEDSAMVGMLGINVYRVFMVVFGIGAMAAGFRRDRQRAGRVADPRHGRGDPGADVCRRRDRRRRVVSRRDPRRPDRRRNTEPHLDGQPGLFGGDAVRRDDAGAAAAAARPARLARAANRRCCAPSLAGRRPDRGSACSPAPFVLPQLGFAPEHGQPDPDLGFVRHRLRHSVRLHRPAVVRAVGVLRHRRFRRRLPADQQSDVERDAGAVRRHARRGGRRASWSASSRCAAPASISR